MSGRGLYDFFLRWRGNLQINGKNPDLVIYIEHEAWDEFNLALAETLEPSIGTLVTEDAIRNLNKETKLLGFKFRRAPKEPPDLDRMVEQTQRSIERAERQDHETFDEASGSWLTEGDTFGQ